MSDKLKPCPFCGGECRITTGSLAPAYVVAQCQTLDCRAASHFALNAEEATRLHNRRAEPVRKVKLPPEITRFYGGIPDGAVMYYKDSVIDELKAAGIEVE